MKTGIITPGSLPWDRDTVENRYGLRLAALLTQNAEAVPHDLSERLRVARLRAVESGRWAQQQARVKPAVVVSSKGTLTMGGDSGWGWRLASLVPLLALVAGLVLIQDQSDTDEIRAAADIDAALLSDDLPPDAYADVGFAEFLRRQE